MEEICSICKYGDGKWKERQGIKIRDDLSVCEKCKADGWTNDPKEVMEAISNDPELGKLVNRQSPY